MTTSPQTPRPDRWTALPDQPLDIIVVGGGIIGAGIARDAASRGLRVALFEKDDYASGTSSRSTRLIHGGLRYLEMLDFGLVRLDLKEREILLRLAPHLVKPLPFLVPMYRKSLFYRFKLRIGMWLYDWLSFDKSLPNHKFYSRTETLQQEPALKPEGLQGAALYYDGQVSLPERLTMENIVAAREKGALCFNHARVESLIKTGDRVVGVKVSDTLHPQSAPVEVRARLVINAAGAWLDNLSQQLTGQASHRVRRTKGIHFTAPPTVKNAVVLFAEEDDRLFFVIPWLGYAWVGTTDTDFDDELESVRATREDVEYLLASVRKTFPQADWDNIYFTNAGVRALVRENKGGQTDESAVSRKHAVVDHEKEGGQPGLLSVVGGKITAYRGIAEEVVNRAARKLGVKTPGTTAQEPLPGGTMSNMAEFKARLLERAAKLGLDPAPVEHLVNLYGSRAGGIIGLAEADPPLAARLHPAYPDLRATLRYVVEHEQCLTLGDFMMRRTSLYFTPDQGRQAIPAVLDLLGGLLGWEAERCAREEAAYRQELAWTQDWKTDPAPQTTNPASPEGSATPVVLVKS